MRSFELSRGTSGPGAAAGRLESLRRAARNLPDLRDVIDRYTKFIAANPGTPAADDAKADLAVWQDRLDRGYVKVGVQWVTPRERDDILGREAATAEKVRDLLRQGRLQECADVLKQALADDPQDPAALYLRGVLLATQDQVVPARQAFEQAAALVPNHGPTLNNVAVMMWKQKLYPAAMNAFNQAMASGPGNQAILDNVAEAINALPEENKDSPPAKKAAARFAEQDADLAKRQESEGLYRWGSTWVTAKKLDEAKAAEERNNAKLDEMQGEFDGTRAAVAEDEAQMKATQDEMQRIDAERYAQDAAGNMVRRPLPLQYSLLQQDLARFAAARQAALAHLQDLRDRAKQVRQNLPVPKYTGVPHVIGAEGTPLRSDLPATQPAGVQGLK